MIRAFGGPDELAEALADYIVIAINNRLARDGNAAIAVSGGTTPVKFFKVLSGKILNWQAVTVSLVDDRWVPSASSRSNAALVYENLLQGPAAATNFLPLVNHANSPEEGRDAVERAIVALPLPFAAVVLGMGVDGHTASFFPDGDHLESALNPAGQNLVQTMHAPSAIEPRITLTLPPLLAAEHIAIHIEGAAKRHVLDTAMKPGLVEAMPIRSVLSRKPSPDIFWCP